ncbi:glycoside hydrolase superfamily [Parasitella parasitica]|nr:glycoside hydrolase superfamily [Parasitella parasitica]
MRKFISVATATILLTISTTNAASFLDKPSVATYWGQNSVNKEDSQESLASYCDDKSDVMIMSFVLDFKDGSIPLLNLANACDGPVFPGTTLLKCDKVAEDIKTCQKKGKPVIMSLGGANGAYGFTNDANAEAFADTLWNLFGGGESKTRPFGDAVLDGFDLDIESGGPIGYAALVKRLRKHFASDSSKQYYISAAPQCPYPDAMLSTALNAADFDFVNVQFYNNYCSPLKDQFNFNTWDKWAKKTSPNKNVKVFLGTPGSSAAAGSGYIKFDTLEPLVKKLKSSYSSFGGVTLWDAASSYANKEVSPSYQAAIADLVHEGTSTAKSPNSTKSHDQSTKDSDETDIAESASSSTCKSTDSGIEDGAKCSTNGKMVCLGKSIAVCNIDKWVIQGCGSGLACFPTADCASVYCDLATKSTTKRSSSIEANVDNRSLNEKSDAGTVIISFMYTIPLILLSFLKK